jgi:hypothetical protein
VTSALREATAWRRGRLHRGRQRQSDVKGGGNVEGGDSAAWREATLREAAMLRAVTVQRGGRLHQGRRQQHYVGVEEGDNSAEGGGDGAVSMFR